MESGPAEKGTCAICKREFDHEDLFPVGALRPALVETVKKLHPTCDDSCLICSDDLGNLRRDYVRCSLEDELGELSELENEVVESLKQREILSENIEKEFEHKLTFGERLSDQIAEFGGSWKFIIIFGVILFAWMGFNLVAGSKAFDVYPFIFLNLVLSCLAAIQAPIIMMSQNRSEQRDRLRAENDYKVNLKAELEIRHLHEKMDHLLRRQYNRLFETQQIQIELLQELNQQRKNAPSAQVVQSS